MNRYLGTRISRWRVISALAIVAVAMFSMVVSSSPSFAATCSPNVPLDASGGSATCDMNVSAAISGGLLTLANDADAAVPGSPFTHSPSAITANFNFTNIVQDQRGNTTGWSLLATSPGISNGFHTLPLNLTALDPASSCTNGSCAPVAFSPVTPLTTSPATFLTAGNVAHTIVVDGTYTNKFNGQFTIPQGASSGVYTGHISITLSNTF